MSSVELKLSELPNPLKNPPWVECNAIYADTVKCLSPELWVPPICVQRSQFQSRYDHMRRIAWLVGFPNHWHPITVMRSWSTVWPVKDGNHRLAAAHVLGHETIKVNLR